MTRIAPGIYSYATAKGDRFAARFQLYGKPIWRKGFIKAKDARDYLGQIQVGKADAKYFPERVPAPTLADYATVWLANCALRGLRTNTLRSYRQNLDDHVLPFLGTRPIDEISRTEIKALLRGKEGYSRHSVRLMLAPLSALYSEALDEGLVQQNPCLRPGRLIEIKKRAKLPIALTVAEQAQLLDSYLIHCPEHYAMAATLFMAGVRIGEAMALERSDVKLDQSTLLIKASYGRGELNDTPKNSQYRLIDLDATLVHILARHLERIQAVHPKTTQLFCNSEGGYLHERNWSRRVWEPMVQRAGVRRVTPHCARHTYATHKLEEGRSLQWLSAQLGHSSIQITVDTYGHMAQRAGVQFQLQPPVTGSHHGLLPSTHNSVIVQQSLERRGSCFKAESDS